MSARLSDDDERRGAEMFAAGASEREVADALGCSASTAHRLRERLAAGQDDGAEGAGPEMTPVLRAFGSDVVLTHPGLAEVDAAGAEIELETEREDLAEVIAMYEDRAQASREALAELEAERLRLLDTDADAAPLRPRIAQARDDLTDSETAAQLARGRLASVEARLAELAARRDLAGMREQLAAAIAERDEVLARSGERQRAAVLAVRAAAVDFTATFAEEQAAMRRADQLAAAVAAGAASLGEPLPVVPPAVPTSLHVDPSHVAGGPLALMRAFSEARIGRADAVAVQLAEAFGWLPPDPEEAAAEYERMRQFWESRQAVSVPAAAAVAHPAHWPASVSLDEHGRPLAPPDPERLRPQQAVRPGALGFTPRPS